MALVGNRLRAHSFIFHFPGVPSCECTKARDLLHVLSYPNVFNNALLVNVQANNAGKFR